jgi:hypothetical protein
VEYFIAERGKLILTTTVEALAGRYHHPSRAAGFPGPLPVLIRNVTGAVATASGPIAELQFQVESRFFF